MDTRFKNTDFFIEDIDESVKDLTVNDSSVSHLPANTDFFIENIDNNVIEICTDRGITPTAVSVVPANTDFFIVNIDSNVKKIASDLSITPSSVQKVPANTDFFIENIYFNLVLICEELNIEPYEISATPTNTDLFIEAIAKNVEKIMEAQTEIHVSGTFIHAVLSADSKISEYELEGNATQNGTPTPDSPVAVQVVTGGQTVEVVGKNLFDKDSADTANGYLSSSNGAFVAGGSSYATKNATFLTAGDYVASQMLEKVCQYAMDGSFVGLITRTGSNNEKFAMPSNGYVRLQFASAFDASTFQLELGSTATAYEPYQGQEFEVNLGGTNLLKYPYSDTPNSPVTRYGVEWTDLGDGTVKANGTPSGASIFILASTSDYITVEPNTAYTISGGNRTKGVVFNFVERDSSGNVVVTHDNIETLTFTTDASTTRLDISLKRYSNSVTIDNFVCKPMLQLGSVATPYVPYTTYTIELAKIGTYQDRIYKTGGKWYIEKQVGKVVLDGTEVWVTASDQNTGDTFYATSPLLDSFLPTGASDCKSNNFPTITGIYGGDSVGIQISSAVAYKLKMRILKTALSTVDVAGWESWLASHPTTVYYALATPTDTEITDETLLAQLNAIYALELKEGIVNISITATSPNLPASLKATIIAKE